MVTFQQVAFYVAFVLVFVICAKLAMRSVDVFRKYFGIPVDVWARYGGGYALVTGASAGIGKQLALQCAARGFHLILVGSVRTHAVAKEIRAQHRALDVRVVERDFARSFEPDFFKPIFAVADAVDLCLLVNNVGMRSGALQFEDMDPERIRQTVAVGTLPQVRLMQYALRRFRDRARGERDRVRQGSIVSITAQCVHHTDGLAATPTLSVPYLSVYEATNAFGYFQAQSVYEELRHRGLDQEIDFLNITPGAVLTDKTQNMLAPAKLLAVHCTTFARNIMDIMGRVQGEQNAHWKHEMNGFLVNLVPFVKPWLLPRVGQSIAQNCSRETHSNAFLAPAQYDAPDGGALLSRRPRAGKAQRKGRCSSRAALWYGQSDSSSRANHTLQSPRRSS